MVVTEALGLRRPGERGITAKTHAVVEQPAVFLEASQSCPSSRACGMRMRIPSPEAIPAEARQDELERRMAARRALIEFKNAQAAYGKQQSLSAGGGAGVAAEELVRPTVERQRIWMDGEWKKRVPVHRQEIKGWGTFYLKGQAAVEAKRRQPSTTILDPTDRGDKYVKEGSVYLQRSDFDGEGLFLLSGVRGLPKGSIVGPYAGTFFNSTAQSRHKTGSKEGTHWVTLRIRWAVMPTTVAGIDGAVRPKLVNGRRYNLEYYLRNGLSSLANSRPQTECNCKLVVEYPNYESVGKLYIDDEFCPVHVPMNQRVTCIPPAPTPHGPHPTPQLLCLLISVGSPCNHQHIAL
jgi:hypothetical protein